MTSRRARPDRRGAGRDGVAGKSASNDELPSGTRKLRCAVYMSSRTQVRPPFRIQERPL